MIVNQNITPKMGKERLFLSIYWVFKVGSEWASIRCHGGIEYLKLRTDPETAMACWLFLDNWHLKIPYIGGYPVEDESLVCVDILEWCC